MARDVEQLVLTLSADIRRMEKGLNAAQGKFDKTANYIEKRQRELDKNLSHLGEAAGVGLGKLSLAAGVAFGAITAYSIKAASDAAEVKNAFDVAFGGSSKAAQKFAEDLSQRVGRSVVDVQGQMSQLQLVLSGMGLTGQGALNIVEQLTARAIDIGSLFNVDDARAAQAVISAITGEAEPMKRFGAVINETAVKAELLRLGFKGNAADASDAAKAIARANLILQKTSVAAGDAERTINGTANQLKVAKAEFHDAAVTLGNELLPAFTAAIKTTADLVSEFNELPTSVKLGGLALLGLVAAGGPIAGAIGGMIKLISYAQKARVAMAGIAGANVAAGATGAAGAAGVGVAGLGAPVAVGALGTAAILTANQRAKQYRATAGNPMMASDAALANARDYNKANRDALLRQNGGKQPTTGTGAIRFNQFAKEARKVAEEITRRGKADAANQNKVADAQAAAALAGLGNFGLSGDQSAGGGGKGGKGAAAKASKDAAREAEEAVRRDERFQQELTRAHDRELAARDVMNASIEERAELDLLRLAGDAAAQADELTQAVRRKELTQAQADELQAVQDRTTASQRSTILARKSEALEEQRQQQQQALVNLGAELLQLQIAGARTAKERRALELQLLAQQQKQARAELEDEFKRNPNLSKGDKDARRQALGKIEDAQAKAVEQANMGPLAQWRDQSLRTADEIAEAYEGVAVRGLESLSSGLVDVVMGTKSVGEAFSDMARGILAELAQIAIRRAVIEPLSNMLFPGAGGGAGGGGGGGIIGAVSSVLKLFGRRANGGTAFANSPYMVGERGPELMLPGRTGTVVPNHVLNAMQGQQSVKQQIIAAQPIVFDLRGAVMTDDLLQQMNSIAAQSGIMSVQAARQLTRSDMQRRARRSL